MSPVRSAETFEAYRSTTVSVHESQADVRDLLRSRKATGMQITESWHGEDSYADVRFGMAAESSGFYAYRLRVKVAVLPADLKRQPHQRTQSLGEVRAQKERQIWRLLYWWLKAQFEAAEAGLIALEEAFLPWMELPDGRTFYETAADMGGLAKVASGTLPALLGSGR
jgi:hypothetical protein